MNRVERFMVSLAKMWVEGWRVICLYLAFNIVLGVLYFPLIWIIDPIGNLLGVAAGMTALLIAVPGAFAGTCRFLQIRLWPGTSGAVCARCQREIERGKLKVSGTFFVNRCYGADRNELRWVDMSITS